MLILLVYGPGPTFVAAATEHWYVVKGLSRAYSKLVWLAGTMTSSGIPKPVLVMLM